MFTTKGSESTNKTKAIFDSFHPSHFINEETETWESRIISFIHRQSSIFPYCMLDIMLSLDKLQTRCRPAFRNLKENGKSDEKTDNYKTV